MTVEADTDKDKSYNCKKRERMGLWWAKEDDNESGGRYWSGDLEVNPKVE